MMRISNINDLPDEILCRIISLFPIKEAVRTSVLSRRWRHLFSLISNLDIMMDINEEEQLNPFMNFVDRLVFFRGIPSILKFRLQCCGYVDPQRLEKWISALAQHKIQEFDLGTNATKFEGLLLPASLFSCESLVKLRLVTRRYYDIKIPSKIYLPCLKWLCFQGIGFSDDGSEQRLFSSCPVLEFLGIIGCRFGKGCINFSISNQNVKRLSLKYTDSCEDRIVPILLDTPNLAHLNYKLCGRHSLVLLNVKSVVQASISSDAIWSERRFKSASDVLRGVQNIHTLLISSCILQDLRRHNIPIPVFGKLTCITVSDWRFESDSSGLEYLLSHCVVLETLRLRDVFKSSMDQDSGIQFALQESSLTGCLSHLKKVHIYFHHDKGADALMAILKFFLKNCKVLEELDISSQRTCSPEQQSKIMSELPSFPRASKNCRVTFPKR